jgi:uncharacterized protein YaaW (UPF0174 family)
MIAKRIGYDASIQLTQEMKENLVNQFLDQGFDFD